MDTARADFILPPEYTGPVSFVVPMAPSVPSYIGGTVLASQGSWDSFGVPEALNSTVRPGKKNS